MDINKIIIGYRKIIDELALTKNMETDLKKKKDLENFENTLRRSLRSTEIHQRIKSLYIRRQFIEYICFLSQFIEFQIKQIISQCQELAFLTGKKLQIEKDLEEKPLGGLINTLENKCVSDFDLIKQLRDFNELRIRAIHKIFEIKYEIEDVENEIEIKLNLNTVYKNIINSLERYIYGITNKIINTKDKSGAIPSEAKSAIEKIRKKMEKLDPLLKDKNIQRNIKI